MDSRKRLEVLLKQVLAELKDPPPDDAVVGDLAFHLCDCITDLEALAALVRRPEDHDIQHAKRVLQAIAYHAAGHLVQAARILDYFPDQFAPSARRSDGAGE